jgi:hypothetical protein
MSLNIVISILTVHFISDFLFQSHWMAVNKSHSKTALTSHVVIYSIPFLILFGFNYALMNGLFHYVIDYFTSKGTKKLWENCELHWFFVVVGFDQMLHLILLFLTASVFL